MCSVEEKCFQSNELCLICDKKKGFGQATAIYIVRKEETGKGNQSNEFEGGSYHELYLT
jgi:hypothetical protein